MRAFAPLAIATLLASIASGQEAPPPEKIQAAVAAGKVTLSPGAGATAVRFADYEKAGDVLTLTLDSESKSMRQVGVDSWLDKPENHVSLDVSFQSLPDGTSYAATTLLKIPESKLEVRIENSNYEKLVP